MKKVPFVFGLLFIITFNLQSQCGQSIKSSSNNGNNRFYYSTLELLDGSQPDPVTPTSSYTIYKFELITQSGYVLKTKMVNPNEYIYSDSNGGTYLYRISWTQNDRCAYSGEHGNQVALKVSRMNYFPVYYGGFLQQEMELNPFPQVCSTSSYAGMFACFSDNDNDNDGNNSDPKPNLTLSKLTIKVDTKTYDVKEKGEIPEFKNGVQNTFNITIKNDDDGYAASSKYTLLVSEENKYPDIGSKPVYEYRTTNGSNIEGNSERTTIFHDYFYDNIGFLNLENGKTYYMFLDIDLNDDVDESNETNGDNLFKFQFKYKDDNEGKISIYTKDTGTTTYVDFDFFNVNNNFKIVNLNDNSMREFNILGKYPSISISTLNGLFAVYVNNIYIKKITNSISPIGF